MLRADIVFKEGGERVVKQAQLYYSLRNLSRLEHDKEIFVRIV